MDLLGAAAAASLPSTAFEFCANTSGGYALNKIMADWKSKAIIRKDRKFIKQQFPELKYSEYPIEEFFLEKVVRDARFLYSGSSLPPDKEDLLVNEFWKFIEYEKPEMDTETMIEDDSFKHRLVHCLNEHNRLMHEKLLTRSEKILAREIKNKIDALGYAGHTLSSEADLLTSSPELEYAHQQIDGILRTLRMDLKFYRLMLLLCVAGTLILTSVLVIYYPKYQLMDTAMYVAVLFFTILLVLVMLAAWILMKISSCEKRVTMYTDIVWKINIAGYKMLLQQIMCDEVTSCQEDETIDN